MAAIGPCAWDDRLVGGWPDADRGGYWRALAVDSPSSQRVRENAAVRRPACTAPEVLALRPQVWTPIPEFTAGVAPPDL